MLGSSKHIKYKKYKFEDVSVYHKNGLVHDNYCGNLEFLDKADIAKKTAHLAKRKSRIIAIDIDTNKEIGRYKSMSEVARELPISIMSVSNSLNKKYGTDVVGDKYIFKREEYIW